MRGDPFTQHSNEEIWAALEESQLAPWVRERGGAEERGCTVGVWMILRRLEQKSMKKGEDLSILLHKLTSHQLRHFLNF